MSRTHAVDDRTYDVVPLALCNAAVDAGIAENDHAMLAHAEEDHDAGAIARGEDLFGDESRLRGLSRALIDRRAAGERYTHAGRQSGSKRAERSGSCDDHRELRQSQQTPRIANGVDDGDRHEREAGADERGEPDRL